MLGLPPKTNSAAQLNNDIGVYLHDVFSAEDSALADLRPCAQWRIADENFAKFALVLEADDPQEYCYQNLIREINSEAETGIYLARSDAPTNELRELARDSGVSGRLHEEMAKIAPVIFSDELAHSDHGMDLVWVSINARYDRAKVDATVSELIMYHFSDSDDAVADMSTALRALHYAFHEDTARRRIGLPSILNERSMRDLVTMISDLADRGDDYPRRVAEICERAGTA
jgi:hypothetical protein